MELSPFLLKKYIEKNHRKMNENHPPFHCVKWWEFFVEILIFGINKRNFCEGV